MTDLVSQPSIVSQLPIGFNHKELKINPLIENERDKQDLLSQQKKRILAESRLYLNDS